MWLFTGSCHNQGVNMMGCQSMELCTPTLLHLEHFYYIAKPRVHGSKIFVDWMTDSWWGKSVLEICYYRVWSVDQWLWHHQGVYWKWWLSGPTSDLLIQKLSFNQTSRRFVWALKWEKQWHRTVAQKGFHCHVSIVSPHSFCFFWIQWLPILSTLFHLQNKIFSSFFTNNICIWKWF